MILSGMVNNVTMKVHAALVPNTPPWFSVEVPESTNEDIEVRICHSEHNNNEGVYVEQLELYIQYS